MVSEDPIDPELRPYIFSEPSQSQYPILEVESDSPSQDVPDKSTTSEKKSWTWNYGTIITEKGVKKWRCSACRNPSKAKTYSVTSGTGKFAGTHFSFS